MADPRRNPDGTLTVPISMEEGEALGDGMATITAGHPLYEAWDNWLTRREQRNSKPDGE